MGRGGARAVRLRTGVALFKGVGKFDALYGMDVRAALLDGLRQRPGDVVFLNDAHAFLTGEWSAGTVRGHRRAVGITLGTGVGSAFLADGHICDNGPGVPPEGRMDLTEIGGRPLEDTVSRRAILSRYGDPTADVHDIAGRARAGRNGPSGCWTTSSPHWASCWARAWWTSARPPWSSEAP